MLSMPGKKYEEFQRRKPSEMDDLMRYIADRLKDCYRTNTSIGIVDELLSGILGWDYRHPDDQLQEMHIALEDWCELIIECMDFKPIWLRELLLYWLDIDCFCCTRIRVHDTREGAIFMSTARKTVENIRNLAVTPRKWKETLCQTTQS